MTHFINANEVDNVVDTIIQITDGCARRAVWARDSDRQGLSDNFIE